MTTPPLSDYEFREIYSRVPKLCVEVLVVTKDGVVLSKRNLPSWYGYWHIPGVTLRYKEEIDMAIQRVAREELGIKVEVIETLGCLEYLHEEEERGFGHSVSLVFLCKTPDLIPEVNQSGEMIKCFKEVPSPVVDEHVDLLNRVLQKSVFI